MRPPGLAPRWDLHRPQPFGALLNCASNERRDQGLSEGRLAGRLPAAAAAAAAAAAGPAAGHFGQPSLAALLTVCFPPCRRCSKTQCRLGVGRIKLLRNKKQIAVCGSCPVLRPCTADSHDVQAWLCVCCPAA